MLYQDGNSDPAMEVDIDDAAAILDDIADKMDAEVCFL